ncbi:MAG: hypothetical protein RRZ83_02255 [Alistipes sp.]
MNNKNTYQAPELHIWSIAAEQGFAASATGDFPEFEEDNTSIWK